MGRVVRGDGAPTPDLGGGKGANRRRRFTPMGTGCSKTAIGKKNPFSAGPVTGLGPQFFLRSGLRRWGGSRVFVGPWAFGPVGRLFDSRPQGQKRVGGGKGGPRGLPGRPGGHGGRGGNPGGGAFWGGGCRGFKGLAPAGGVPRWRARIFAKAGGKKDPVGGPVWGLNISRNSRTRESIAGHGAEVGRNGAGFGGGLGGCRGRGGTRKFQAMGPHSLIRGLKKGAGNGRGTQGAALLATIFVHGAAIGQTVAGGGALPF